MVKFFLLVFFFLINIADHTNLRQSESDKCWFSIHTTIWPVKIKDKTTLEFHYEKIA